MIYYGLFDLLIDAAILTDWGPHHPPLRHRISMNRQDIGKAIDTLLEQHQHDTNVPVTPFQHPRLEAYKNAIGSKAWAQVKGDVDRVHRVVRNVAKGLSPQEIEALRHSDSARALLSDYVLLANHAAAQKDGAALAQSVGEALPELCSRLRGYATSSVDHGTIHELFEKTAVNEAERHTLRDAIRNSDTPRIASQAFSTAFSNAANFKASLGSALRFRNFNSGLLLYGGAAVTADAAIHLIRPHKEEKNPPSPGERVHGWKHHVLEGAVGVAAMIGAVMMAGRHIQVK